jgi:hypothetical protein
MKVSRRKLYDELSDIIRNDTEIGELINQYKENPWPLDELGLVNEDGFFNKLTEDQAQELSGKLSQYLPKFTSEVV